MSASEGNVYLCAWSKKGKDFKITLKKDERITVTSDDFRAAEELMWELLCEKFGDGEAVVEYDKPLPKTEFSKKFGNPEILTIAGNASVGRMVGPPDLFSGGFCIKCQRPLGSRTKHSLEFDYLPTADGAVAFGHVGNLFSEDFLSLLSDQERALLSLLPVVGPSKSRKQFFELVGAPIANYVGVPFFPGRLNTKCNLCGRTSSYLYLYKNQLFRFIALQDLPERRVLVLICDDHLDRLVGLIRSHDTLDLAEQGTLLGCWFHFAHRFAGRNSPPS